MCLLFLLGDLAHQIIPAIAKPASGPASIGFNPVPAVLNSYIRKNNVQVRAVSNMPAITWIFII